MGFEGLTIIETYYKHALSLHNNGRSKAALDLISKLNQPSLDFCILQGVILRTVGRYSAAEIVFQRLLNDGLEDPVIRINLANVLIDLGRCGSAISVLAPVPELNVSARRTLGLAFLYNNEFNSAIAVFDALLQQECESIDYQWHLAISYLSAGLYRKGWALYESRKRLDRYQSDYSDQHWNESSSLNGATVLIYSEQGFGDNIQFSRFLPILIGFGARVTLVVKPELLRLFGRIKGVEVVSDTVSSGFDFVASLLSLPFLLKLYSSNDLKLKCDVFELPSVGSVTRGKLKVGLVWSGKMKPKDRSVPLNELSELFKLTDIELISLQFDENKNDISKNYLTSFISTPKAEVVDFYDSGLVMAGVDLVVSIDSAPLHLACSLGVPAIGLLLYSSDWRWQSEECIQPWYEDLILLRQTKPGCWRDAVLKLTSIIKVRANEKC